MNKLLNINNLEKVFPTIPVEDGRNRNVIVYPDEYKLFWSAYDDKVLGQWWLIIDRIIRVDPFDHTDNCLIRLEYRDRAFTVKNPRTWLMPIESLYAPDVLGHVIKIMIDDENFIPMFSGSTSASISTILNGPFTPRQSVSSRYSKKIVNPAYYGNISGSMNVTSSVNIQPNSSLTQNI
jgi:hypothetical protein